MDIATKKNEKGEEILEIMSGYATGTELNLSVLINYLGDSIALKEICNDLIGLAMRYSINLLRNPVDNEEQRSEALNDLLNIELYVTAFSRSIKDLEKKRFGIIENLRKIIELKEERLSGLKDYVKSYELLINDKDERIKVLKERIEFLTRVKEQNEEKDVIIENLENTIKERNVLLQDKTNTIKELYNKLDELNKKNRPSEDTENTEEK